MRVVRLLPAALFLSAATALAKPSVDIRAAWKDSAIPFAASAEAGAGFSFKYGGKNYGPRFGPEWHVAPGDIDSGENKVTLSHVSGLVVTREMRVWPRFNAVEYTLRFKNETQQALPPISEMQALHLSFGGQMLEGNCLVAGGGGLLDATLPPASFAIRQKCFSAVLDDYSANPFSEQYLTAEGGRSSGKDLPFFFIQNDTQKGGIFVAVGWSGQWLARTFLEARSRTLNLTAKIPGLEIALEPGEEIRGPSILVGLYAGSVSDGSNQMRRLIRDAYTPKLAGKQFLPVATYDTNFGGIGTNWNEALLRKLVDAAAAIGQEIFLVDVGWFENDTGDHKSKGLYSWGRGNWYKIDRAKLPNGLRPVADYVRSKGLQFGMWFEPETVDRGSQLARQHPEWVLWDYDSSSAERDLISSSWNADYGLLDYGRPEVQQWARNLLDHYIREYGIKYLRYDFNIVPLPYWDTKDKPNRRGISQLRHIQGLYAVLDWIREQHPDVILEGCAAGGRRIDLEMTRRFHTFWISDYTTDPAIVRFHLFGINYFLPGNYHYVAYIQPSAPRDSQTDSLSFESLFGGALGTSGRLDLWSEQMIQGARRHVAIHKEIRRNLIEDFYPLSAQPADRDSWSGWQFNNPTERSGFLQTFRLQTSEESHRFFAKGLDKQASYEFANPYSGDTFRMTGAEAMAEGINMSQPPLSSRVLVYKVTGADELSTQVTLRDNSPAH